MESFSKDVHYLLNRREFRTRFVGSKKSGAILTRVSGEVQRELLSNFLKSQQFFIENLKLSEHEIRRILHYNSLVIEQSGDKHKFKDDVVKKIQELAERFINVRDKKADFYDDNDKQKELEQARYLTQLEYDESEEWKKHVKSIDPEVDDLLEEDYIIPEEGLGYLSFLYNFSISMDARYVYNKEIPLSDKVRLNQNSLQHTTIKIIGEIPIRERLNIKGEVACSKCKKKSEFYYCEMNGEKFKCKNTLVGDEQCNNSLTWKQAEVTTSKNIYFYQVMLTIENGRKFGHMTLCSSLCKLVPGVHKVQLLVREATEGGIMIVSKDYYDVDQQQTFLTFEKDEKYKRFLQDRELWDHNIFFINYRIRKMLREKANIAVQDESSLLALSMIFQAFDRIYGNKPNGQSAMIHLMAIADSGTGKSFISQLYGGILFPRFLYVENSLRMSMPGMTGGSHDVFIGEKKKKIFTYGMFSEYDYIVFNEVTDRITRREGKDIGMFLKAILDAKSVSANIVGGKQVPREASVSLIGNLLGEDAKEYEKTIRNQYKDLTEELSEKGEKVYRYRLDWPLFMKLNRFKFINEEIYEVHKEVRHDFVKNQGRDFMIDVDIPLLRRFPLYYRVETTNSQDEFEINEEEHLTVSERDINEFIDANKVKKELEEEFPFIKPDKDCVIDIYDYLKVLYENHEGLQDRKFKGIFFRMLSIFMSINKEKKLSEATKKVFEMMIVNPAMDFISKDEYNCVLKRQDLEQKEMEVYEEQKQKEVEKKDTSLSMFDEKDV